MFLMKRGPKGKEYLYLVEYGHDKTGKRIKTTVKSFGKISSIPKEELNAIYAQYQQPVQERKLAQKIVHEKSLRELVESVTVDSENKTNFNKVPLLHYGHLILKPIWDKLGLNYKLRYLQNKHTKVEAYSLSKLLFYFVAHKILSPGAYLRAWKDQSTWLCNPIEGVCLDNVYEALDYFDAFSEEIMTHAVKSSYYTNNKGADTLSADGPKMVFFDCTNCYFETDSDDREQFIRRFTQKMREGLAAEGKSSAVIESVLASKQYTEALLLAVEENEDEFLRMRGPSKEGRFSLPIVSVSLVIDERGVPIDFTVFPGNKSEYHQVLPAIERLKEKYHVKDCYFVADRGLNSTINFDALLKGGFGFIVAQKVTGQSKKQEKIMLSEEGWKKLTFSSEENLSYLNADLASFRYKVCDIVKTKHLTAEETGDRPKTVKVNCKIIYIYDDKRKKRDLYELEQAIAKAGKAVNEKKLMGNPSGSGWRALVKTKKEEAENEDDKEMYQAVGLKDDVIEKRRQLAGYAAIVYEDPKSLKDSDKKLDTRAVLGSYHSLEKIEECFRVMKNSFEIRPMYVKRNERTRAHVLICVLSLMVLRLMQIELARAGSYMTVDSITSALNNARLLPLRTESGTILVNCEENEGIYTDDPSEDKELSATERYLKVREENPDSTDLIMKTMGLSPLGPFNSVDKTKLALKIAQSNNSILGDAIDAITKRIAAA